MTPNGWKRKLVRFLVEPDGQDMIEYALVAAFIGIVGVLAMNGIVGEVFDVYTNWMDPSTGVPSLWDPPEPGD